MSTLLELAERCEKATGPDRELDKAIALFLFDQAPPKAPEWLSSCEPQYRDILRQITTGKLYTASIDAAMTLVPEGWHVSMVYEKLSGWAVRLTRGFAPGATTADRSISEAPTFALALCAASLRARSRAEEASSNE